MPIFNKEDLISLEKLSRINLSKEQEEKFLSQTSKILDYMKLLDEIDTNNIEPLTHVIENMETLLAEDEITDHLPREQFLENTPSSVGGFLKVPAVLDNEE